MISPAAEDVSRSPAGRAGWQEAGRAARPVSRVVVASRRRDAPYLLFGVSVQVAVIESAAVNTRL